MTTLTATRPPLWAGDASDGEKPGGLGHEPGSLFDGAGGGPTLDDVLSGVWEGLAARAVVDCPMCGGELLPEYGSGPLPIGGRCRRCGTSLS